MSKTRLLLATSDDPHVVPLAPLVSRLESAFDCQPVLLDAHASDQDNLEAMRRRLLAHKEPGDTIIGGFSLGARIAASLCQEISVAGLIGLSFPFHQHGNPAEQHGLAVLGTVTVPTLIVQGTRDSHGNREAVRGMQPLPEQVRVYWLEDANHRWRTRGQNGDAQEQVEDAAETICSFAQHLVSRSHV